MRTRLHIRMTLLLAGIMLACATAYAQEMAAPKKKVKGEIRAWKMTNDYGIADTVAVDTLPENFALRSLLYDHSMAWAHNGNLISPSQSKLYFDRSGNGLLSSSGNTNNDWLHGGLQLLGNVRPKMDFLFGNAYEPLIITPQDVEYHRTSIAYSDIEYKKTFKRYHEENDIHFSFTGNVKPRTNIGVVLNYLTAPGRYLNQEGKLFNGYVNGSYDGHHYGLHAAVTFNNLSNFENGGLVDPTQVGGALEAEDLPVKMHGMSGFSYIAGYLDHHYTLTRQKDTVEIPMLTFNHVFEVNNSRRRYIEKTANQSYFNDTFLNRKQTNDSANTLNIRNTLSVTLNEQFNRALRFGATAYVTNENQRVRYKTPQYEELPIDTFLAHHIHSVHQMPDTVMGGKWMNNTLVGGSIYKRDGRWIHYYANGDICLVGYKIGEFQVNGNVDATIPFPKDSLVLRASAYVKNETPSWYMQHYRSNHYLWDNDFQKTYRFFVGGEVCYPSQWIKLRGKVGFENITRYIYFAQNGYPVQHDGNIQVLTAELRADLTTPWLNWENNIAYQLSSDSLLPLPTLTLHSNIYYHGWWFKAMYAQMGVNLRFHTRYYAPVLNPATGQFCIQDQVKVGNYPEMNLYGNFFVKHIHLRFFAEWQNFSYLFMKKTPENYMIMPNYAINPHTFRAGAAFYFWR